MIAATEAPASPASDGALGRCVARGHHFRLRGYLPVGRRGLAGPPARRPAGAGLPEGAARGSHAGRARRRDDDGLVLTDGFLAGLPLIGVFFVSKTT